MAHLHFYALHYLQKKDNPSLEKAIIERRERGSKWLQGKRELVRYFSLKTRGSSHRYYCWSAVHSGDRNCRKGHWEVSLRGIFVCISRHSSLFVPNEKVAFSLLIRVGRTRVRNVQNKNNQAPLPPFSPYILPYLFYFFALFPFFLHCTHSDLWITCIQTPFVANALTHRIPLFPFYSFPNSERGFRFKFLTIMTHDWGKFFNNVYYWLDINLRKSLHEF